MFDRFIRLARARKALHEGRFEDAVQLALDPLIHADRRAEDVRSKAQQALWRRGRERLAAGDAAAAARDLQRAVAVAPHAEAEGLLGEARRRLEADGDRRQADQLTLDEARRAAERGRLQDARRMVAGLQPPSSLPTAAALLQFVNARQQQAAQLRQLAEQHLARHQVDAAVEAMRAARALDADAVAGALWNGLIDAAAARLAGAVDERLAMRDEPAALVAFRQRVQAFPELQGDATVVAAGRRLAAALHLRLRTALDPEQEIGLVHACAQEPALPGDGARLLTAAQLLQRLPALRTSGRATELETALRELAAELERPSLSTEAEALRVSANSAQEQLQRARAMAAVGDLAAARAALVLVLQELPMHEDARSELDAIDRGSREREQRLLAARQAAKAGRLREAYALVLADAQPGPAGEEARLFAQELRARIDLVGRGLDQVRAALHGRTSGGSAGLNHCLLRVEELAKVQADHEDIPLLRAALAAEIAGIECAESALAAAEHGQYPVVAAAVATLVDQRPQLLLPDRLDARILELADLLATIAEAALAAGRLREVEASLPGVAAAVPVRPGYQMVVDRLRAAVEARRQRAEALVEEAAQLLAARDLTGAEQRCEAARQLWVDGSGVRKIESELQSLRHQEARLLRVEAMAAGGDMEGANAEMGEMPPTPPLLRTRIFDMKQNLARAQGLDGAFLLRVDEGGEFVALRGETLSIGNLRDGRADLPILAAIAGRHARIQRSMSFHGGMQDTIVAEGGELRVAGHRVDSHRFRIGDRVQLGASLQVAYGQPSKRSLTASLQLLQGFQVAGTDRVLLFKDRGRDGRILMGPGQDVHVRVASAKGEVELFANKGGQMRVRCEGGGDIDGHPFRDEHPVAAGATVRAAGISFVLLPWVRSS